MSYNTKGLYRYLPNQNITVISIPDYNINAVFTVIVKGRHYVSNDDFRKWVADRRTLVNWCQNKEHYISGYHTEQYHVLYDAQSQHVIKPKM
jgi:hypothetical protein